KRFERACLEWHRAETAFGLGQLELAAGVGAANRLCRLEAVTARKVHPPFGDLLRGQLADTSLTEDRGRLAEQPAQLLDRHRLHVVLGEVNVDELREGEASGDPLLAADPVELTVERVDRVLLGGEATALDPP